MYIDQVECTLEKPGFPYAVTFCDYMLLESQNVSLRKKTYIRVLHGYNSRISGKVIAEVVALSNCTIDNGTNLTCRYLVLYNCVVKAKNCKVFTTQLLTSRTPTFRRVRYEKSYKDSQKFKFLENIEGGRKEVIRFFHVG